MACALSMLWDEFTSLGAGSGDLPAHGRTGAAYMRSMRLAAHRVRQNGGPEKLHYALAPELMALYAETLLKRDATPRDQEIATSVREVAAQGGLIRRAGSGRTLKRRE